MTLLVTGHHVHRGQAFFFIGFFLPQFFRVSFSLLLHPWPSSPSPFLRRSKQTSTVAYFLLNSKRRWGGGRREVSGDGRNSHHLDGIFHQNDVLSIHRSSPHPDHDPFQQDESNGVVVQEMVESSEIQEVTGITVKVALDGQGGVADAAAEKSLRFTSAASLDGVHRLRRQVQAVLVGRRTVQADNPRLLVYRPAAWPSSNSSASSSSSIPQPLRVILDPHLTLWETANSANSSPPGPVPPPPTLTYHVLADSYPTVVYHAVPQVDPSLFGNLPESVRLVYLPPSTTPPSSSCWLVSNVWQDLQEQFQVRHVLVEGGAVTARLFLQEPRMVDRAIFIHAEAVQFQQPLFFLPPEDTILTANPSLEESITSSTKATDTTFPPPSANNNTAAARIQQYLRDTAGLQYLGSRWIGPDRWEYWIRPGRSWPTPELSDWP